MKPERVFHYFREISNIPRESGNEKAVSDYIKSVGENLGLYTVQDELLNVYIRKEASQGCENAPGVIIQGHMDMVCEKTADSVHDFTKDAIKWVQKGDILYADNTTLGADNGIAIAMALSVLEDDSLVHPQIEVIITTGEETEMEGALGLSESLLRGEYLLNIDSEEEGILTLGSAGGILYTGEMPVESENKPSNLVKLNFDGFFGGHSGTDIDKNRRNMVKVIAEFLEEYEGSVADINCGTKDNAIPRSGYISVEKKDSLMNLIETFERRYTGEEALKITVEDEFSGVAFTEAFKNRLTGILKELPSGVDSSDSTGVVSSSNLAVVEFKDGKIVILDSIRSSDNAVMKEMMNAFEKISDKYNVKADFSGEYPSWEKRENSRLQKIANEVYEKETGKKFENVVIHAGLECGAIYEKYPKLDIISFGPDIRDAHTPKENLSISSTERMYNYTVKLIEEIAHIDK